MENRYFPYNWDSCSCVEWKGKWADTKGVGCAEWDSDGVWCYVDDSCDFEKMESNTFSGYYWSKDVC